ncbi:MAG: adenosine deaminase [Anaerolineae bacterium]
MPKVDLHRHLEGSVRLETILDLARRNDVSLLVDDLEGLKRCIQVIDDPPDFHNFLEKFESLHLIYTNRETVERVTYEAIADAAADNVKYLELRFSPDHLARQCGFAFDDVIAWVSEARDQAARDFGIRVQLLATVVREYDQLTARRIMEAVMTSPDKVIAGLDLAGDEVNYPLEPYVDILRPGLDAGLPITVHAGEALGAASVKAAIDFLNPQRLGHGVRAIEDEAVLDLIRQRNIVLEICPTSNLQTGVVANFAEHPLKELHERGISVTINTDDPCISDTTLTKEYQVAVEQIGITLSQLKEMILNGVRAAFLPIEEKEQLQKWFKKALEQSGDPGPWPD